MSIARGRSLEEATNQLYASGVNRVRNLRALQRQILDNSNLTSAEKDVMLDRVRSETWFTVNPASSRINLELLSPANNADSNNSSGLGDSVGSDASAALPFHPNTPNPLGVAGPRSSVRSAASRLPMVATIQEGDDFGGTLSSSPHPLRPPPVATGTVAEPSARLQPAGASGDDFVSPCADGGVNLGGHRLDGVKFVNTSSMSLSSFNVSPRAPVDGASRMSLRRQPDFVMVAGQDDAHGVIMRPHNNTFSVTGGARKSQLILKTRLSATEEGDASSSSDEDFSDMEEADDLDLVFDPLTAPLEEDEDLGDLTVEEEAAFTSVRGKIAGAHRNGRLNLVAAAAEAQGTLSVMEDRSIVLPQYSEEFGISDADCALLGVFDGHSGTSTSQHLAEVLPTRLAADGGALVEHPKAHMRKVFTNIDAELVHTAEEAGCTKSGSTANVVFIRGESKECNVRTIFCGNVGDSRCVLSRGGKALAMSIDHKPSRPDEAERIRAAGGWVAKGRLHGVLAVSRAFGDVEHKGKLKRAFQPDVDFRGDPLIADPEVAVEQLLPSDDFAIVACDGLWDVVTSQQAVNFVRRQLARDPDVDKAAQALVKKALDNMTIDNVSVVIACFHQEHEP